MTIMDRLKKFVMIFSPRPHEYRKGWFSAKEIQ